MQSMACIFNTEIGFCSVIWSKKEVEELLLPESNLKQMKQKLKQKSVMIVEAIEAPLEIKKLVRKIQRHMQGDLQDFSQVLLTKNFSPFQAKVYQEVRKIPPGVVLSYKDVGMKMGGTKAYRAIGTALGKNPIPILIPCHRVVGSNAKIGGFSAPGGLTTKKKLLKIEGITSV